jgi:hypothetical protein
MSVHSTHCCKKHGCKYGDDNCPVVSGIEKAKYMCEDCENGLQSQIETFLIQLDYLTDDQRLEIISHYCKHCGSKDTNCQCWNDE